jgi:hydroxyversicolorone monooxygenase
MTPLLPQGLMILLMILSIIHTARWPKDYQAEEWKKDRVAVIGSGATSIQTVPAMQPYVKHMDVFVCTGVWFIHFANNYGQNYEYTAEQKDIFRHDPDELVKHAKDIEDQINGPWGGFFKNSEMGRQVEEFFLNRMKEWIKDERLLKGFTPKFGMGCRRVTPGDPYMLLVLPPLTLPF